MKHFLARTIVIFLKKYKLNIHDSHDAGRDKWMWLYNLFYTEYKDKLKTIPDLEITHVGNNFKFSFELDYAYKNIQLDINDLTWFLTRNRYIINKNCKCNWYYYNLKYSFEKEEDYLKMKTVFSKTNKLI
jgi:hypothetical protein